MDIKVNKDTVIVFDLDDTLYKEIDYLKSAYQSLAKEITPTDWRKSYAKWFGAYRKGEDVFQTICEEHKINKEELLKKYREHIPNITIADSVRVILTDIKKKEGKLAIVTDGRSKTQRNKIKALNISDLFDCFVISEEIDSEKPNKKNFEMVQDHFNKTYYYYIADNIKKDFIAPNTLNWQTVGLIDNGQNIHNHWHEVKDKTMWPKFLIESLDEIKII